MSQSPKKYTSAALNKMTLEEAFEQLEEVVSRLESGATSLDQSIHDYQLGMQLKQHCSKKLEDARLTVEKIVEKNSGKITTETQTD